jgi:hypothetical protein
MENAQELLVIIVSATLTVFLIVAIILLILIIKVVRSVKRVTDKAEILADKAESIADVFKHASTPLMIGKLLSNVSDMFRSKSKRK